jgi:hypothetical protein
MTRAIPYSQIGPIGKGKAVPFNNEVGLLLNRLKRDYSCKCGGELGYRIRYIPVTQEPGLLMRVTAQLFCYADQSHHGIRRNPPPNRPLSYQEVKARGMLSSRRET